MAGRFHKLYYRFRIEIALFISIAAIIISLITAIYHIQYFFNLSDTTSINTSLGVQEPGHTQTKSSPLSGINAGECIDVRGKVFGDIIPGSNISLYETSSLKFNLTMEEIRTKRAIKWSLVNESHGFMFSCISPGKYAFVIPSSSYNGSVGSPLPYEFDCRNLSLRIVFQGGDSAYAVGAFSIESIEHKPFSDQPACTGNQALCLAKRKGLYRECLHE